MNKENRVKLGIVGILFVICILIFLIVYFNKGKNETINNEKNNPFQMQDVVEYSAFFSVVNDINKYLFYNYSKNSTALYQVLNKEFVTKNNLNTSNVLTKLELFENNVTFKAMQMYYEENGNNILYYVIGNLLVSNYEEMEVIKENVKLFVLVDYRSLSYSIYPIHEDIEEIPIQNKEQSIVLNAYNEMQASGVVTDHYICSLYYADYLDKLNKNMDETYNLLEEDFKNKNYSNQEKYVRFMKDKIENISSDMKSCNISTKNNKRVYTINDSNNNSFTFIEEAIMDYKVSFRIK